MSRDRPLSPDLGPSFVCGRQACSLRLSACSETCVIFLDLPGPGALLSLLSPLVVGVPLLRGFLLELESCLLRKNGKNVNFAISKTGNESGVCLLLSLKP